mgnify:CR=1 FL=1
MRLSEIVAQLEAYKVDSDAQLKQLRKEVHELRKLQTKGKPRKTTDAKHSDVVFGQAVQEMLKEQHRHPLVVSRDIYSTRTMFRLITSFIPVEVHGLESEVNLDMLGSSSTTAMEYRKMCTRLVNSGLFVRRKTQRYVPADFQLNLKSSRRRLTCIVARNFEKYESLSESYLDRELVRQEKKADALYSNCLREQAEPPTTELDSAVSFL